MKKHVCACVCILKYTGMRRRWRRKIPTAFSCADYADTCLTACVSVVGVYACTRLRAEKNIYAFSVIPQCVGVFLFFSVLYREG